MILTRKTEVLGEKPVTVSVCVPEISHGLIWDRNRAVAGLKKPINQPTRGKWRRRLAPKRQSASLGLLAIPAFHGIAALSNRYLKVWLGLRLRLRVSRRGWRPQRGRSTWRQIVVHYMYIQPVPLRFKLKHCYSLWENLIGYSSVRLVT